MAFIETWTLYKKLYIVKFFQAFDIIERYFGSEEDDSRIAPSVDAQGQQFEFNPTLVQQPTAAAPSAAAAGQQTGQSEQPSFQFWKEHTNSLATITVWDIFHIIDFAQFSFWRDKKGSLIENQFLR